MSHSCRTKTCTRACENFSKSYNIKEIKKYLDMAQQFNDSDDIDTIISQIDTTSAYYLGPNNQFDDMDEVVSQVDLDDISEVMSPIDLDEMFPEVEVNAKQKNGESHCDNSIKDNNNLIRENYVPDIPVEMMAQYQAALDKILPKISATRYVQAYDVFLKWQEANNITSFKEDVMMCYFYAAAQLYKPSTVWSMYSMLKKTLIAKKNVDISKHCQLLAFLKTNGDGYESKKSEIFEPEQVQDFMLKAPNIDYLGMKVNNQIRI